MRNIAAVYLRELRSYFSSQIFYIIAAVFILVLGNLFRNIFFEFATKSMQIFNTVFTKGDAGVTLINVNGVSKQAFQYMIFFLMLITPFLTMRLYAEERKSGTIELLMTSPITTTQILLGKFFSCFTIYSLMVILTIPFMIILFVQSRGQLDINPVISSYCGTLLLGMALIAIGLFGSSLTENQIVAAMVSFSINMGLYMLVFSAQFFSKPYSDLIAFFSLSDHLNSFILGFIGIKHIVYYFSMTLFWLVVTGMIFESARWRQ
jgi:ABC-2 type transport system permease protein